MSAQYSWGRFDFWNSLHLSDRRFPVSEVPFVETNFDFGVQIDGLKLLFSISEYIVS